MLKKFFILPLALVAAEEAVISPDGTVAPEVTTPEIPAADEALPADGLAGEDPLKDMKLPDSLDDLLGGKDGEDPAASMQKLQDLMKQMEDMGIDLKSLGGKGAAGGPKKPSETDKMEACTNLAAKRAGQYRSNTLSQLSEIENAAAASEVSSNDLMQQIIVCQMNISDEEFGQYKSRKMKTLPDNLYEVYTNELPAAEQKLKELDPLLFDVAQTAATALVEAGDRKSAKNAQTTGGVPGWMGMAVLSVFFGAIAMLAWIVIQMQKNLEEKKSASTKSSKKDKKRR